jgi:hypothetical protein
LNDIYFRKRKVVVNNSRVTDGFGGQRTINDGEFSHQVTRFSLFVTFHTHMFVIV